MKISSIGPSPNLKKYGLFVLATLLSCVETRPSKHEDGVSQNKYGTLEYCPENSKQFMQSYIKNLPDMVDQKNKFKACIRKNQDRLATAVLKQFKNAPNQTVVLVADTHITGGGHLKVDTTQDDIDLEVSKYRKVIRLALKAKVVVLREGMEPLTIKNELDNMGISSSSPQFFNIEDDQVNILSNAASLYLSDNNVHKMSDDLRRFQIALTIQYAVWNNMIPEKFKDSPLVMFLNKNPYADVSTLRQFLEGKRISKKLMTMFHEITKRSLQLIQSNSRLEKDDVKKIDSMIEDLNLKGSMTIKSCLWVMQDLRDKLMAEKIRKKRAEGNNVLVIVGALHTKYLETKRSEWSIDPSCSRK